MRKRALAVLCIILLVAGGLWLYRQWSGGEQTQIESMLTELAIDAPQTEAPQTGATESEGTAFESALAELPAEQTTQPESAPNQGESVAGEQTAKPDEHGAYTKKDDVLAYLIAYERLPENFITKDEARKLGWSGGGLDDYAYGMCIGGDRFGNREGLLPEKSGRSYTECDVDTLHKSARGAKRIVFSNDGLIYYTGDHYESFTLLYGEP